MRFRMLFLALVAVAAVGLGATGSVAASKQGLVEYQFRGELAATPPPNSASLLVDVAGGNQRALRLMVGQPSGQAFAVNSNTEYLRWVHGVPTVVQQSNLAEGDQLVVRIRAPRGDARAGRRFGGQGRRRPRSESRPRHEAALAVPGDAQRARRERSSRRSRPGRQPSCAEGDARPGAGSVVRLRPADGVHQVAGPRAHAHLSEPAHRRRSDQRPDPRPRQLVARTGRGNAGEPRRRARARF